MNKKDLIAAISENTNLMQKEIEVVIDSMIDVITESLKEGKKINISKLGCFEVITRKGRESIHPKTKEIIKVEEKKSPKFKPSSTLSKNIL